MRVMISQPMNGKKDEEIKAIREELIEKFKKLHIDVVDSFINEDAPAGVYNLRVYYLGRTIMNWLHSVDAVYFVDGWREARGCRIEHQICIEYGIKCIYSDFFNIDKPQLESVNNITIQTNNIRNDNYPKITWEN